MRRLSILAVAVVALLALLRAWPRAHAPRAEALAGEGGAAAEGVGRAPTAPGPPPARAEAEDRPALLPAEWKDAPVGKPAHFFPETRNFGDRKTLAVVEGALPPGLALVGGWVDGVPEQPRGRHEFTLEARDEEGRTARQRYAINVVTEPVRLRYADFVDTVADRRAGEGDSIELSFDGRIEIVEATVPGWRLEGGRLGEGAVLRARPPRHGGHELVLGAGAFIDFAADPVLVVSGPAARDALGAPLECRAPVRQGYRRFEVWVGDPVAFPLAAVDPPDPRIEVTGLPGGLAYGEDGWIRGTPLEPTLPKEYPSFRVGRRGVRYEVWTAPPVDPALRILSVDPPEVDRGGLVTLRTEGGGEVLLRGGGHWDRLESATVAGADGETLFCMDWPHGGEVEVLLVAHERRSAPVTVRVRDTRLPPDRTPRVDEVIARRTADGPMLFLRGAWLAGPDDDEAAVRVLAGDRECAPLWLARRCAMVPVPEDVAAALPPVRIERR